MQGPIYRLQLEGANSASLSRKLHKAAVSRSSAIVVSYPQIRASFQEMIPQIKNFQNWDLWICVKPEDLEDVLLENARSQGTVLILEAGFCSKILLAAAERLRSLSIAFKILMRPEEAQVCLRSLKYLGSENYSDLYFEFLPFEAQNRHSWTVEEVARFIQQIERAFPGLQVRPLPGWEFFHKQIPADFELEATETSVFEWRIPASQIRMTVVIPAFNAKYFLGNAVRHLFLQTLPRDQYEVIIVDDGSDDASADYISSLFVHQQGQINLRYLFWPRALSRQRGDSFFRAGLARNLGVRYAQGDLLTFLDADMLVDAGFLERRLKQLEKHDVIQSVRYHIHTEKSFSYSEYSDVSLATDIYIEDRKYWSVFFEAPQWQALPFFWKYTCTYCLSLKKADFYSVGRFYRNFVSYGFEDTHIGYRLAKAGKSFFLDKTPALHLTSYSQSEYKNSKIQRMMLLEKTAKVFFLNTLDLDLYHHFSSLMGFEGGLLFWIRKKFAPSAP